MLVPRRRRLVPLAAIALLTALGHLALIDAVASDPLPALAPHTAPEAPPEARRVRAVRTQFVAPPMALAPPVAATAAIAPVAPVVVQAKRPRARPMPLAQAAGQPRPAPAAAVEPPWIRTRFDVPAPIPAQTRDDSVAAGRPSEPALLAAASAPEEASSEPAVERLPVYPTRIPGAFRFVYQMSRGLISGRGELALHLSAEGYEARLEGSVAGFSILEWISRGGFDDAGFAPLRFTDQRRGRGVQAANFQRANHRIIYSGTKVEAPLPPGAQDRLSWMLQLAAIAQARPERLVEGERITLFVSGARGDADAWTFQVGARSRLETPAGPAQVVPLLREPRKEYDMRAQVWLDPTREYLPVKARLQSSRDGGDALELLLQEVQTPP